MKRLKVLWKPVSKRRSEPTYNFTRLEIKFMVNHEPVLDVSETTLTSPSRRRNGTRKKFEKTTQINHRFQLLVRNPYQDRETHVDGDRLSLVV